ncbi:MAG: hypothetical protein ACLQIQ_01030 [Beijerinckiaceae bacterium]
MFFPIRCAIWLTIVYTMIFTQDQAERREAPVAEFSQTVQSVIARAIGQVEARVAQHCTRQPSECLRMAARLSDVAAEPRAIEAATVSQAPLPPPRPNSQALGERAAPERLARPDEARSHAGRASKS